MRKSKRIKFNGGSLDVHELTVEQIKEVMDDLEDGTYKGHILDAIMDHKTFPAHALFMSIAVKEEDFDLNVAPSDLEELYQEVIDLNPSCASTMERMRKLGTRLQESAGSPAT